MGMIVVTGAAGFIGSCLVSKLNNKGHTNILMVDDFDRPEKVRNFDTKAHQQKIDRNDFLEWFEDNGDKVDFVFHIGARTDTTEFDVSVFDILNVNYTKEVWRLCTEFKVPMVYASSAATYGMGELGYIDDHDIVEDLMPLNAYGESKNDFDIWAVEQQITPPFWAGMKFFNVYGPNEYHKARMASVIFHAYHQIRDTSKVKLFRSHNEEYKDGEQLRDFIYVKDVVDVLFFMMIRGETSGLYNLGTGKARTFVDLAKATFKAMDIKENIEFIDTPEDIRDKYQYFTEADISKLRSIGYDAKFYSLEEGVEEYVQEFLLRERCY